MGICLKLLSVFLWQGNDIYLGLEIVNNRCSISVEQQKPNFFFKREELGFILFSVGSLMKAST